MNRLSTCPPPPSNKSDMYGQVKWRVCESNCFKDEIIVATKECLPTSMQDDMDDKDMDFPPAP